MHKNIIMSMYKYDEKKKNNIQLKKLQQIPMKNILKTTVDI